MEPATIEKIFEYLTQEPPEDAEEKRRFKYPYLASEILSAEIWTITEAVYDNEALLKQLYWYLDAEHPNQLLTTYTTRVAGALLGRKVAEVSSALHLLLWHPFCFVSPAAQ